VSRRVDWRLQFGPPAAFAVFLIVWLQIWNSATDKMHLALADFARDATAHGVAVSYGELKTRGFPFYLRGSTADFSIATDGVRYACAALHVDILPYATSRIVFSCSGDQFVTFNDVKWGVEAPAAKASVEHDRAGRFLAILDIGGATFTRDGAEISVASALVNAAPDANNHEAVEFSSRVTGIFGTGSGRTIALDRLDAALTYRPVANAFEILGIEAVAGASRMQAGGKLELGRPTTQGRVNIAIEKPGEIVPLLSALYFLIQAEDPAAGGMLERLVSSSDGEFRTTLDLQGRDIRIGGLLVGRLSERDHP
jgi:hypothetical protein